MAVYGQISVDQAGDIGGNGLSRFNFVGADGVTLTSDDVNGAATAVHDFYTAIKPDLPPSISYAVQPEVLAIDTDTGELQSIMAVDTALSTITGSSGNTAYPAGVGIRVNWQTGNVVKGRRLKGALYLVPLGGSAWQPNGSLNPNVQAALIAAVGNLAGAITTTAGSLVVVHKPAKGTKTGGLVGQVVAWTIGTTPASLRSRRV